MARIDNLTNFLTDVANAIRSKTGDSDLIAAEDFDTEIENIPSGGSKQHNPIIDSTAQQNQGGNPGPGISYSLNLAMSSSLPSDYIFKNKTPKKGFVFGCVRGEYQLSNNLTLLAETDWFVATETVKQKLFVCWCDDLTRTSTLTVNVAGRVEFWYIMVKDIVTPTASDVILNDTMPVGTSTYTVTPPNKPCFYFTSSTFNTTAAQTVNYDSKFGNVFLSNGGRLTFYASYDDEQKNILIPGTSAASGIIGIELTYDD